MCTWYKTLNKLESTFLILELTDPVGNNASHLLFQAFQMVDYQTFATGSLIADLTNFETGDS